jgi:RNA polymerase sigma factor for flagellar operon FliA
MTVTGNLLPSTLSAPPRGLGVLCVEDLDEYMPMVRKIAARFLAKVPRNVERDDLIAAGTYGLLDALRKNPSPRGPWFEGYVFLRVRGAIVDELRTQDWLGRNERRRETESRQMGAPSTHVMVALDDLPGRGARFLCDESTPSPLEVAERNDERGALATAMSALLERDRILVDLHYFQGVQLKEIASRLGVSKPRASQLHSRALATLRRGIKAAVH